MASARRSLVPIAWPPDARCGGRLSEEWEVVQREAWERRKLILFLLKVIFYFWPYESTFWGIFFTFFGVS